MRGGVVSNPETTLLYSHPLQPRARESDGNPNPIQIFNKEEESVIHKTRDTRKVALLQILNAQNYHLRL